MGVASNIIPTGSGTMRQQCKMQAGTTAICSLGLLFQQVSRAYGCCSSLCCCLIVPLPVGIILLATHTRFSLSFDLIESALKLTVVSKQCIISGIKNSIRENKIGQQLDKERGASDQQIGVLTFENVNYP